MAWYAAKDSEFLPPALGGKGYVWKAFDGFPY